MKPNIDFVTEHIAIGGDLDTNRPRVAESQLAGLIEAGITHIVDCRGEYSDARFVAERAPWIEYLHNGTHDDGGHQPDVFFDRGVNFARDALARPGTRVLLHCHMGINRGPSMGFAVLLDQGHDPIGALDAIRQARPIAATSYARDALLHHLANCDASAREISSELARLDAWEADNRIDVPRIIREVRSAAKAA